MGSQGHCHFLGFSFFIWKMNRLAHRMLKAPPPQPPAVYTSHSGPEATLRLIKTQSYEPLPHISTNSAFHDASSYQAVNLRPKLLTEC